MVAGDLVMAWGGGMRWLDGGGASSE